MIVASCEEPNTTERADQIFDAASQVLSFHELSNENWPTLYKISHLLQAYSTSIGYPQLIINPDDSPGSGCVSKEYASITFGRDDKFPAVYLWQASLRQEDAKAMLHGRSAASGENWQLITFDAQHAKSSTYIHGHGGRVSDFILRHIVDGEVIDTISNIFAANKEGVTAPQFLGSTGLAEISSAQKKKIVHSTHHSSYLQIDENELPAWIDDFITRPVHRIAIPTHSR